MNDQKFEKNVKTPDKCFIKTKANFNSNPNEESTMKFF